jgi:hypothetical protein
MSAPGAAIPAMPGDLERLPAAAAAAAPGAGPAALAAELLGRMRAGLPVISELEERDQVVVSAWLTGLRSVRWGYTHALAWSPVTTAARSAPVTGRGTALPDAAASSARRSAPCLRRAGGTRTRDLVHPKHAR